MIVFFLTLFSMVFSAQLDVVIPVHKKDAPQLEFIIENVHKYIEDVRNVYVISKEKFTDNAIWVDERLYEFNIVDVANELGGHGGVGNNVRRGWYYQQLLKLYAHHVIDGLSEHFLILDADTRPNRRMRFIEDDGKVNQNYYAEKCLLHEYYYLMATLVPELQDVTRWVNPVVHHMVFTQEILEEMFAKVEQKFSTPFWKAFCNNVRGARTLDPRYFYAGASEYMLYFFYASQFHPERFNLKAIPLTPTILDIRKEYTERYAFVSHHLYDRTE